MKQVLLGLLILCLVGAGTAAYVASTVRQQPQTAPTFVPMTAVAPAGLEPRVLDWAGKAVADIMTFDGDNASAHFRHTVSRYFTDEGFTNFLAALEKSRMMDSVEAQGQSVHAVLAGAGKATYGMFNASPVWEVEVPAALDYTSPKASRKDSLKVTLRVTASPQNPDDFRIVQWIAR